MRSGEPKALISTGMSKPSTRSKSRADVARRGGLGHAVGDLADLEIAGDGRGDAAQLAVLLQAREEVAQVGERHRPTPGRRP